MRQGPAQKGDDGLPDWIQLIRSEYLEMPGLTLTLGQARRLWNLDEETCRSLLEALVSDEFLMRTAAGAYRRRDGEATRDAGLSGVVRRRTGMM